MCNPRRWWSVLRYGISWYLIRVVEEIKGVKQSKKYFPTEELERCEMGRQVWPRRTQPNRGLAVRLPTRHSQNIEISSTWVINQFNTDPGLEIWPSSSVFRGEISDGDTWWGRCWPFWRLVDRTGTDVSKSLHGGVLSSLFGSIKDVRTQSGATVALRPAHSSDITMTLFSVSWKEIQKKNNFPISASLVVVYLVHHRQPDCSAISKTGSAWHQTCQDQSVP